MFSVKNKLIDKIYKYDVSVVSDIENMSISDIFHITNQGTILHELFCSLCVSFNDGQATSKIFNIIQTYYYKLKQHKECTLDKQKKFAQDQENFILTVEHICNIIHDKIVRAINNKEIDVNDVNDFLSCEAEMLYNDDNKKVSCIDILSRIYMNPYGSHKVNDNVYFLWKNFMLKFATYKVDRYGRNTLQYAILLCNEEDQGKCIEEIIAPIIELHEGIETIRDVKGNSIMHYAVSYVSCNHKIIQYIAESFPELVNVENNDGNVPLHLFVALIPIYMFMHSLRAYYQFFMVKELYYHCKKICNNDVPIRQIVHTLKEYDTLVKKVKLQKLTSSMQVYEAFLLLFKNTLCFQIMKQNMIQDMLIAYKGNLDQLIHYKESGNLLIKKYVDAITVLLKNHACSSIDVPVSIEKIIDYGIKNENYMQFITYGVSDSEQSLIDIQFYTHMKKINNVMLKHYSIMTIPFNKCRNIKKNIFNIYQRNEKILFIVAFLSIASVISFFLVSLFAKNKILGMSYLPYRHIVFLFTTIATCVAVANLVYLKCKEYNNEMNSIIIDISKNVYDINLQGPYVMTQEKDVTSKKTS
ncbi:hypothetical protein HL033_01865 [Neoehrlichia mikurensis]|uniref:Ankyrin repeat domain-containing protein n=1 Tax=Neoehrlichia mikurensis TaxID=89586 RepID=A0A9Q9F4L8_9RICK|nr:hypothetical protein [Neoehrlichia mikurensis]QXK92279.1 hypothetical protein IAH97_01860 [Neoehrlichia mikurensis]QXK92733.1 hypothetical protein HUN61_01855 [Neoehrlichia mikurensis]QXK93974.1 hypothetical protein HL033_01865 [Neoehrlichia mikurensis]UTO55863.1 hypothetical protein LUA82_02250 [Neoehrlichia mikurensis]UTO56779.1 hypothetical protein LUA81_02230 [Neoehrlichia mikurensis]